MRTFVLILLFFSASLVYAQEFNAGIVQGLWYGEESVFAGKPVRIYVAIRNNTGSDLTGTVDFYDGSKRIERKNVQALNGRIIESWADWTPSYGNHTISANLSRIELTKVGSSTQEVEVVSALAEDTLFVDHDTDNDGIGNEEDSDDDGDGVSDEKEKEQGTDPLVKNIASGATQEEDEDDEQGEELLSADDAGKEETQSDEPEGLERYLAESPAEDVFSSVTSIINNAKEDLDTYRESRRENKTEIAATSSETYVDGFGEVARSTSTQTSGIRDISLTDFFASVSNLAKTLFNSVYTFLLAILSFVLGHPMLVQIGVLLLILLLIMKFAAKFGRRPKLKKF